MRSSQKGNREGGGGKEICYDAALVLSSHRIEVRVREKESVLSAWDRILSKWKFVSFALTISALYLMNTPWL